jgi:hypothetical protein
MKLHFTLYFIICSCLFGSAQNYTGIWRGTFEPTNLETRFKSIFQDVYKYEVQVLSKSDGNIEGVTYSYLTTRFFGKAGLKGIKSKSKKTITIKETVMLEYKSSGAAVPCLMTCYLDYSKIGKIETLIGTYTSFNVKEKSDCGSGTVYLEKVTDSDFEKEDFLKPKKSTPKIVKKPNNTLNNNAVKNKPLTTGPNKNTPQNTKPNLVSKPKIKPGAENFVIKKNKEGKLDTICKMDIHKKVDTVVAPKTIEAATQKVLLERDNIIAKKLKIDEKELLIEFYDNGEIDGDSITVFKDNKLLLHHNRLGSQPISITIKFDKFNTFYELIITADNLGFTPPNTALMVVTYGGKREEIFLTSDEKRNAKVILEYSGSKRLE